MTGFHALRLLDLSLYRWSSRPYQPTIQRVSSLLYQCHAIFFHLLCTMSSLFIPSPPFESGSSRSTSVWGQTAANPKEIETNL